MPVESRTCDQEGVRLDSYAAEVFDSSYSRSFYRKLIDDGKIRVNGKVITKAGTNLSAGDIVEAEIPEPVEDDSFVAQDIPLDIVYEDSDLLVINKIDIAEYVHASLEVMDRDTKKQRGDKPYVFTDLYKGIGLDRVIQWIKEDMLFEDVK